MAHAETLEFKGASPLGHAGAGLFILFQSHSLFNML